MKRPWASVVVGLALVLGVAGCAEDPRAMDASEVTAAPSVVTDATTTTTSAAGAKSEIVTSSYREALTVAYDEDDLDASWNDSTASFITLAGPTIRFDGKGATATGRKVTITQAGTYVVSGSGDDAQIVVDCEEVGMVRLVLDDVDLACADGAPIYVKNAEKVILVLAEGTQNFLTDGPSYKLDEGSSEPDAAVFSHSDLTINGTGSLTVKANYNDGITSKDVLKFVSGVVTVDAVNDAINGRDCLGIKASTITVTAKGDGLQSTNDTAADKGFICVSGGIVTVTAGSDGIQAKTTLLVTGGTFSIVTGGGSANAEPHQGDFGNTGGFPHGNAGTWGISQGSSTTTTSPAAAGEEDLVETDDESSSSKGLKAGGGVFVQGGTFTLDCSDDAIHSNTGIEIDEGEFAISSGDDAIHADESVTIDGGDFTVSTCYEGIESNVITLNGGNIVLASSDDAINGVSIESAASTATPAAGDTAAAGTTSTTTLVTMAGPGGAVGRGMGGGMPGESGNARLSINGGYVVLDSGGDGLDINGTIEMTAGTVIVNGPTENMNGAIDYLSEFKVTGGYLLAVGSSGMAEAPSEDSTQYVLMVNFDKAQSAGTIVRIEDEHGNGLLTFAPAKQFQSLVLTSSDLKKDATYKVFLGGSMTGAATNGLYADGAYSGGSEYASLTVTSIVTVLGTSGMLGGMGGGFMQHGGAGGGTAPGGGTRPGAAGGATPPGGAGGTLPSLSDGGTQPSGGAVPGGAVPDGTPPAS